MQTAREQAEQLLTLAKRAQDPALLLAAHETRGETLFWLGELVLALEHFKKGVTLYEPQQHGSLVSLYGVDLGVVCQDFAALLLQCLGYPDQALKRTHTGLTLAQGLSHPYSVAFALFFAAWLHQIRREGRLAQEQAEAMIALSSEHGFPELLAGGTIWRGWTSTEQGHGEEGIAQMRQGLASWRAAGSELNRSSYLALLAEAHGRTGQAEEGLSVLAKALDFVHKTGERFYEAELYRLKGQLTLQKEARGWGLETSSPSPQASSLQPQVSQAVAQEAEGYFLKAIEIARRQSAKSLVLRAAMSLSRLWQQQGKKEEARQMLAEVYGWFTEGFDTADLKEAKVLLEELGH